MTITVTTVDVASNFTYSSLQSKIADWLHRQDLTSAIPDFIAIAEARMNGDLLARDMESTTTLTTVSSSAYVATPSDMLEVYRMQLASTPYTTLQYMSPDKLAMKYAGQSGAPERFTVVGGSFQFGPTPDGAYSLTLDYRGKLAPLSTVTTTNWLLQKWPYAYLYGSLCASAPYLRDDNRVPVWEQEYKKIITQINSIDWYSGSTPAVRAV